MQLTFQSLRQETISYIGRKDLCVLYGFKFPRFLQTFLALSVNLQASFTFSGMLVTCKPIWLIMSVITDRVRRYEVLLPISQPRQL